MVSKTMTALLALSCAMIVPPAALAQSPEAGAASTSYTDSYGGIEIGYDMFRLDNGLTVIVYSDHSVPTIYIGTWYKVGSKDEPDGRSGFAHLFEHLMFQQTENRRNEYFEAMNRIGATGLNGTTSTDRTNYFQTVPTRSLDAALWIESDRMANLLGGITQEILDEQRDVVKNEKRQGDLRPGSEIGDKFREAFFPQGHPYAHSVIGSMEDLEAATLEDVHDWFNDKYGPNNAVVVLAGDIDVETAREKVEQYYGAIPGGNSFDTVTEWMPVLGEIQSRIFYSQVPTARIERTWALPNADHEDLPLLALVGRNIAGDYGTPLFDRLVEEERLALGVTAGVGPGAVSSTFTIGVDLAPGADVERVKEILDAEIARFFESGADPDRLRNSATARRVSFVKSIERPAGIGAMLAENWVFHGDATRILDEMEAQDNATGPQIGAMAEKWLSRPYFELEVRPNPSFASGGAEDVDRTAIPEIGEAIGDLTFPMLEETRLENGLRVVVLERRGLPMIQARLVIDAGAQKDINYAPNVARNAFAMLSNGTENYDREALRLAQQEIASSIGSVVRDRFGILSWSSLSEYSDDAMGIAAEMVQNPVYPQEEIDRLLERLDPGFDSYEASPANAAYDIFSRAIWGDDHFNGRITTRAEAKQISAEMIRRFHENEFSPVGATLYLAGDISLAEASELAARHFGDWEAGQPSERPEREKANGGVGRVILVDSPGAQQSSIVAGHLTLEFDPARSYTGIIADGVLGAGFLSRLNMNLREDKGWAYGFRAGTRNQPEGPGVFYASGSVQSDKTAQSMVEIRKEIAQFVTSRPANEAEVALQRESTVLGFPARFSSTGEFLDSAMRSEDYGLPYDFESTGAARAAAVTVEDVNALARQMYDPDRLSWVIVGDLERVEQDIRDLGFGEVEVWDVYGNRIR